MSSREKGLLAWQLTMLALGTVIGGSFFLASAIAIKAAGPAVIISYILGGILVYLILFALSEMAVADQAPGSFRSYCEEMYGPVAGFTVGWVYWTGLVLAMSSEAIAVSIFIKNWLPDFSLPVLGSFVIIAVTVVNLLGIDKLSKLESGLAAIKLIALAGFIILAFILITGLIPGRPLIGLGAVREQPFFPAGLAGIAGSMLIVIFTYAGFEVIGLASSEAVHPHRTIPKAITFTVIGLVGLYLLTILLILPLVPTQILSEDSSPLVVALARNGLDWAGGVITIVVITAIISTMLAATFGIARMVQSLANEGHAPSWIKDKGDIPYRGIIFSGAAMLAALALGFTLPRQVYLFLVSSGGFSLLFVYVVIMATHYKFRKIKGCPPAGKCRFPGYPYTSWLTLAVLMLIIVSMPLVPGQGSGLIAGLLLVVFFLSTYYLKTLKSLNKKRITITRTRAELEVSEELLREKRPDSDKKKNDS